jgi:hypothetical protein
METKMHRIAATVVALVSSFAAAQARELKVATWNLGWHLSTAEARAWIAACTQPFTIDAATGLWTPTGGWTGQDTKLGWELPARPHGRHPASG